MNDAPPRVRVGFLTDHVDLFGGGQRSLCELAAALRDRGVDPVVLLPGPGPLAETLEASRVPWAPLRLPRLRPTTAPRVIRALLRLKREVCDRRLELVHSDSPRTALYAGVAARCTGRRHIWHLRSSRPAPFIPDRLLLSLSDSVIAVSRAAVDRSMALRSSARVRVEPTGLPPIAFLGREAARAALGLPQDRFIAGVIGRIENDKGVLDAVEALPFLHGDAPGALLVFIGPEGADRRLIPLCRARAASAGVGDDVIFLGARREAARFLRGFDLILQPSLHEALPRVLIEAAFAGVPVVASAVGGISEVIDAERTGLLVRPRDAPALGSAAARLARDGALRRRLAEEGVRRAHERFRIDRMTSGVLDAYHELIGNPAPSRNRAGEVA